MRLCHDAKWADGTTPDSTWPRRSALTPIFPDEVFDVLLHGPHLFFAVDSDIGCAIW